MSRQVAHPRPELADTIRTSLPVSAFDWSGMAALANWCMGHGGMLIPWSTIGVDISSGGSGVFNFYVFPKASAVERIWVVNMRTTATASVVVDVSAGGASAVEVTVDNTRDTASRAFIFRESLSAKTSTPAGTTLTIEPTGGTVVVESVACYEQTRAVLDATTDDYGVDIATLRARQPIADFDYQLVSGVMDAYKNLDARRSGYFHWSTVTASELTTTADVGTPDDVFALHPPMLGPVPAYGDVIVEVTCAVYCKVDAGTGSVRFQSDEAGDSVTVTQTGTSYSWVTGTLELDAEDFGIADGRRNNNWEGVAIDAWVTSSDTLNISAISIGRPASANPI